MRAIFFSLTLALFVARVFANDSHGPLAADDLALVTNLFDARANFHCRLCLVARCFVFLKSSVWCCRRSVWCLPAALFVAVGDAAAAGIVRADFDCHAVTRQNADVKLTHS